MLPIIMDNKALSGGKKSSRPQKDIKCSLSCVQLFETPWTVAQQTPLSMEFSRQDTGVGCYSLLQGIFLTQGLNPHLLNW